MQLNVQWRTGVGYGDFVTGLGYAFSSSIKYQMPVNITFHWNHEKDFLYHPLDPESLVDRCNYIHSTMINNNMVTVNHIYNSNPKFRFFNQLDEFNPCHGLWYSNLEQKESNIVVLWSSQKNVEKTTHDKDPALEYWDMIKYYLYEKGFDVREVTYRTPVRKLVELINVCKFGVGYDGLAHQIFKYIWKPLIVFCKRISLNRILIPQASLESNVESFFYKGHNFYLDDSINRINYYKKLHKQYLDHKVNALEHKFYNTPIY